MNFWSRCILGKSVRLTSFLFFIPCGFLSAGIFDDDSIWLNKTDAGKAVFKVLGDWTAFHYGPRKFNCYWDIPRRGGSGYVTINASSGWSGKPYGEDSVFFPKEFDVLDTHVAGFFSPSNSYPEYPAYYWYDRLFRPTALKVKIEKGTSELRLKGSLSTSWHGVHISSSPAVGFLKGISGYPRTNGFDACSKVAADGLFVGGDFAWTDSKEYLRNPASAPKDFIQAWLVYPTFILRSAGTNNLLGKTTLQAQALSPGGIIRIPGTTVTGEDLGVVPVPVWFSGEANLTFTGFAFLYYKGDGFSTHYPRSGSGRVQTPERWVVGQRFSASVYSMVTTTPENTVFVVTDSPPKLSGTLPGGGSFVAGYKGSVPTSFELKLTD
jgi:hypothetical protein